MVCGTDGAGEGAAIRVNRRSEAVK
jgi:hypothetical protein